MFEIGRRIRLLAAHTPTPCALWWSRRCSSSGVPGSSYAAPVVSEDAALSHPSGALPGQVAAYC